tara:strand:+ start:1745 stop:3727 length:1983 start_codon:yes stop_codon:yes gene_type:complete
MDHMSDNFVKILIPQRIDFSLTYGIPKGITVQMGQYVKVPFRAKSQWGIVWGIDENPEFDRKKIKDITAVSDLPPMNQINRQFIDWVSKYTMSPIGLIAKMAMGNPEYFEKIKEGTKVIPNLNLAKLEGEQKNAAAHLSKAVSAKKFAPILLEGVTGSGKTEVYFKAMETCLNQNQQTLILLPEISLSTQWLNRFKKRFGFDPIVWHSDITKAQKRNAWQAIIQNKAPVVVGARSALFTPFDNLGLIIIDEEHDSSFKQESQVIYNARDMAIKRASLGNCPVILSSATPCVETLYNVESGKYDFLFLPNRHGKAQVPAVSLIDMREEDLKIGSSWLSNTLIEEMKITVAKDNQTLLFMNRRGYAPLALCRACGHRLQCPSCSSWLVYHKQSNQVQCHHCDFHYTLPNTCENCDESNSFILYGPGVERIAEELAEKLPGVPYEIISSDLLTTPKKMREAFDRIEQGKVKIVIGTQIMAKGHHFPNLTLVGVLDADLGLVGGDLRAAERTFQLLHQVSGRAGRAEQPGKVLLQTYSPNNEMMQILQQQNYKAFVEIEKQNRQEIGLPPYGHLGAIIISARSTDAGELFCRKLSQSIPKHDSISVFGPSPAPMFQLKGWYRWRFLIKGSKSDKIQPYIDSWVSKIQVPSTLKMQIDIDPYSFM